MSALSTHNTIVARRCCEGGLEGEESRGKGSSYQAKAESAYVGALSTTKDPQQTKDPQVPEEECTETMQTGSICNRQVPLDHGVGDEED